MSVRFRRMEMSDVAAIARMEAAIFTDAWPAESFITEIENTRISYPVVMEEKETILAYAVVWRIADEIQINNIAVVANRRGKGYGSALLTHILEIMKPFNTAWLEVRVSNRAAIGLYEKFNFKSRYRRKAYYSDGEDALIMERRN